VLTEISVRKFDRSHLYL